MEFNLGFGQMQAPQPTKAVGVIPPEGDMFEGIDDGILPRLDLIVRLTEYQHTALIKPGSALLFFQVAMKCI